MDWTGFGLADTWRSFTTFPGNRLFANWAVAGTPALPANGDSLRFTAAGNWKSSSNDFDDLSLAGIRFLAGAAALTLGGNGFTSSGAIEFDGNGTAWTTD